MTELKRTHRAGWWIGVAAAAILTTTACAKKPGEDGAGTPPAEAETPATTDTVTDTTAANGPAMWTLSDTDTTIYLFGTVHVLRPETQWRTPEFDAALAASQTIYTEADMLSEEVQAALGPLVLELGMYADGGTLTATLDDAEEKEVNEALSILGVPMAAIDPMQPWFAGISLANVQMMKAGYQPGAGVESVIITEAKASGKSLAYFETAEEQLRILAGLPEEDQVAFLVAGAEAIEKEPELLDELVADWVSGDVAGIAEIISDTDSLGSQIVFDELLRKRNANWIPQIEDILEQPGVFMVAVGAGHLAGDDSVIDMLRDKGYTVVGP